MEVADVYLTLMSEYFGSIENIPAVEIAIDHLCGFTYSEIAARRGCSERTVRRKLSWVRDVADRRLNQMGD